MSVRAKAGWGGANCPHIAVLAEPYRPCVRTAFPVLLRAVRVVLRTADRASRALQATGRPAGPTQSHVASTNSNHGKQNDVLKFVKKNTLPFFQKKNYTKTEQGKKSRLVGSETNGPPRAICGRSSYPPPPSAPAGGGGAGRAAGQRAPRGTTDSE